MASKDKKAPERAEDEIEHERYEIPGDPRTGVRSITVERRGLQDYVQRTYEDSVLTAAEAMFNAPEPLDVMLQLLAKAEEVVAAGGVLPRDKVEEIVEGNWRDSGVRREDIAKFVHAKQREQLIKRFGHLSRQNKAAQFIEDFEAVEKLTGENEALWIAISRLCESSYWFQMDVTAVHFLAEQGRKARGGRAMSAQSRTQQKALKRNILREVLLAHLGPNGRSERHNFKGIARDIETKVNAALRAVGLSEFAPGPLRKAVGEILNA